jgi:rRNA maturation RNase YbeY
MRTADLICLVHIQKDNDSSEEDIEDAGVSKAMAKVFTLEERIPLLLIHGTLHLLGYDHETPEDWAAMTQRESEIIAGLHFESSASD